MISLGIESTAHTLGIGIIDSSGKVLADSRSVFQPPVGWGIKPVDAANHHMRNSARILESAMEKSGLSFKEIGIISYSQGAGLPPCLRVGFSLATELSKEYSKPLVPVCHQVAHLEIANLLTKTKDPVYLYVSGGNTQIISREGFRYSVLGETQDIGIGNALDKFGRSVGLKFPAGPQIEELARNGKYLELPYVVKGMDLSFSGILTAAIQKSKSSPLDDVCFSLQETMFSMLAEVTERALAHTGKKQAVLTGGVAANKRLTEILTIMCSERNARFSSCPMEFCGDNGVMIAWTGIQVYKSGKIPGHGINPSLRTDDVDVTWL